MKQLLFICIVSATLLSSCGAYFNQPIAIQHASLGEATAMTRLLKKMPIPKDKVVVGVYKFRDQTGQYKASETGSTFSTSVTQGATSILIKALEDSKWFIPIERENLGNLLNERNIIRSTRQEYLKNSDPAATQLTPLLYAGVLLEGGIVSFDSNIITGGFGARYFGAGTSTRYRQDRVSIYLRLVSTSNGEILKTVYISKTILSQAIDASLFRYVNFKRLLEVETGFTKNEPMHLAITEAIEKAVITLVIDGIQQNIWQSNTPNKELEVFFDSNAKEAQEADAALLYDRTTNSIRHNISLELAGGINQINSDYQAPEIRYYAKSGVKFALNPYFNLGSSFSVFELENKGRFRERYGAIDITSEFFLLPKDKITPYFFSGGGISFMYIVKDSHLKYHFGAGLEFLFSQKMGLRFFGQQNLTFSDKIDHLKSGKLNDSYWYAGIGFVYYLGKKQNNKI